MTRPDLMAMAEQERAELIALLRDLTDSQRNAPSLCTRWRVRDVAAHVVSYDELSTLATAGTFLRAIRGFVACSSFVAYCSAERCRRWRGSAFRRS